MTSESLLDLIITNFDVNRLKSGVVNFSISDHLPVFLSVCNALKTTNCSRQVCTYRDINDVTLTRFRETLLAVNWDDVLSKPDPDEAYNKFLINFLHAYYACFQYKTTTRHEKARKPWVTAQLLNTISKRDKLYKKILQTKSLEVLK